MRIFPIFVLKLNVIVMKEIIEKLNVVLDSFMKDANAQIELSNKSAGIRARKTSLEIEKLMKEFRKISLEESKK